MGFNDQALKSQVNKFSSFCILQPVVCDTGIDF